MVVDLATGSSTCETGVPTDYTNDVYKTTKMVFRKVPAGWCRDHWNWSYFAPTMAGNTTDTGANRVQRGGSYQSGDVPTNATVTVGADGTTSLDAGETVTLTVPDVSQTAPRSLFVRIADPSAN